MLWKFGLRKLGLRSRITGAAETEPVKKKLLPMILLTLWLP